MKPVISFLSRHFHCHAVAHCSLGSSTLPGIHGALWGEEKNQNVGSCPLKAARTVFSLIFNQLHLQHSSALKVTVQMAHWDIFVLEI